MGNRLTSGIRDAREARRLTQDALASLAGISRQSFAAIESGASIPSTVVALRLARALSTTVEALFQLPDAPHQSVNVPYVGDQHPGRFRVRMGRVAARDLAYPAGGGAGQSWQRADGVATPLPDGSVQVELTHEPSRGDDLVVLGCDPAFALVVEHLRRERQCSVLWSHRSSRSALEALAAGQAHVVGIHLVDRVTGVYNAPWVQRLVPFTCTHVRFAVWEQDLLVRPGNPLGIQGVQDLVRPGIRFLNREVGAGSRVLLEMRLAEAGIPPDAIPGYADTCASGHLAVAEAVASGLTDVGVGIRAAGREFGLDRICLGQERYDLIIPDHFLDTPAVQMLLESLRSRSLQAQVGMLEGYDTASMGHPS